MKTRTLSRILPLLFCFMPLGATASDQSCHRLMTERECDEHKSLLTTMPDGEAREQYLAEFNRTRKEREAACSCARAHSVGGLSLLERKAIPRF